MNGYKILVVKPEGNGSLGIPGCKDNIKIDFKEIGFVDMNWIHLTSNRNQWWAVVNTVMNLWVS